MSDDPKQVQVPEIPGQAKALVVTKPDPNAALSLEGESILGELAARFVDAAPKILTLRCESDQDEANLAASMKPIREDVKKIKAAFDSALKGPEEKVKALKARRKAWLDAYAVLSDSIDRKTSEWLTKREKAQMALRQRQKDLAIQNAKEAQEAQAQEAEERGDPALAQAIRNEPIGVSIAPDAGPAKVEGARTAPEYEWEVLNWREFLNYLQCQSDATIAEALDLNPTWMKKRVKAVGDSIAIPGVRITRKIKRKGSR